ncbi:yjiC [Symbiodinium pilosum]|uniref:YjiC protein n=1 Tax=Symbiodinium pilosum TaxID=2952 RepID=A0A812R8Q2_SYMPI|nr:yjiC [Symbiodinium pilosum]
MKKMAPIIAAIVAGSFGHSLPVAELSDQLAQGKKIIYAPWLSQIGGALTLGALAFCQHVWKALFAALEDLGDDFLCVLSVGKQPDALDFLWSNELEIFERVPSNVLIRGFVPQVEMLNNYTSVFISHVGFNSLQESLMAGVPLVAIPQAVDQPANARKVQERGWGRAFFKPMETVNSGTLAEALRQVSDADGAYRQAVQSARAELAGGAPRLAEQLVAMAKAGHGHAVLGGC